VADGDTFYWAGGRKVPLTASADVAIDLDSGAGAQLAEDSLAALRDGGRRLTSSLLLVPRSAAVAALGEEGASARGVHPVFHSEDGSLVVVLPQVRVEGSDPERLAALGRSLTTAAVPAHVTDQTAERLTLEPDSGRGEDALALANTLAESPDTDLAQARFLRVVRRPGPR